MVCVGLLKQPQYLVAVQTRNSIVFTPGIREIFLIEKPAGGFEGTIKILYMKGLGSGPFTDEENDNHVVFTVEDREFYWRIEMQIQDALSGIANEIM